MEVNKKEGLETNLKKTIELNEHILIEWEKKDYGQKTHSFKTFVGLKQIQILTFTILRENVWVYKKHFGQKSLKTLCTMKVHRAYISKKSRFKLY